MLGNSFNFGLVFQGAQKLLWIMELPTTNYCLSR